VGGAGGGKTVAAREHVAAEGGESSSLLSAVLFCVFSLSISLLLLFPMFVLLNCPYPDPPVSAGFFPFSSAGGGAAAWPFCCQPQLNYTFKFGTQAWGGDKSRAEQRVLKQLS